MTLSRHRSTAALAAVLLAILPLAACGKTLGSRADFVKKLKATGMSATQAGCVYDGLEGDQDTLDKLDNMDKGDEPPAKATKVIAKCLGVDTTDTTEATDDTTDTTEATDDTTDTTEATDDTTDTTEATDDTTDTTEATGDTTADGTGEADDSALISQIASLTGQLQDAATACDLSKVLDGTKNLPAPSTLDGGQNLLVLTASVLTRISATAPPEFADEAATISEAATGLVSLSADNVDDLGNEASQVITDDVKSALDTFQTEAAKSC